MKRILVLLLASACVLAGLSACEGEAEGDGSASLEGHYVLQQVEVDYTNGDFDIFEDPEDFLYDSEGFYEDYILFDYEYVFERNGSYSFRGGPDEKMVSGCVYSVEGSTLRMSATSFWKMQLNTYKIISDSGDILVLEPTKEMLDLNNGVYEMFGQKKIKKTRGTYLKK